MAATLLAAATTIARTGINPVGVAVDGTNGNSFANTGNEMVYVYNGSGSTVTVTIDAYPSGGGGAPNSLTVTDPTVALTTLTGALIGPFNKSIYNDGSGYVTLTYSSGTTVTAKVLKFVPDTL